MLNKISKNNLPNIVSTARFTMVNLLFFSWKNINHWQRYHNVYREILTTTSLSFVI